MQGILMDSRVSVWRKVQSGSGTSQKFISTKVIPSVPAAIVPVSSEDRDVAFALESTHVIWVPYWLTLRKEDQLQEGRNSPDPFGAVQPRTYTIKGRRQFHLGIPQKAYYARELD